MKECQRSQVINFQLGTNLAAPNTLCLLMDSVRTQLLFPASKHHSPVPPAPPVNSALVKHIRKLPTGAKPRLFNSWPENRSVSRKFVLKDKN